MLPGQFFSVLVLEKHRYSYFERKITNNINASNQKFWIEFKSDNESNIAQKCKLKKNTKGHGWCGTSMNDDISEPEFDIQPDSGKIFLSSNFP